MQSVRRSPRDGKEQWKPRDAINDGQGNATCDVSDQTGDFDVYFAIDLS